MTKYTLSKQLEEITEKNNEFFYSNEKTKIAMNEIVDFFQSDIKRYYDYYDECIELSDKEWCLAECLIYTLYPSNSGIYVNFFTGNLPVCFFQLRFMLEALIKCYVADSKYPSHLSCQQKLNLLEIENKNTTQIINEAKKILNVEKGGDIKKLWDDLSNEWVHPMSTMKASFNKIESLKYDGVYLYKEEDIQEIEELKNKIIKFREIFNLIIESWETYFEIINFNYINKLIK